MGTKAMSEESLADPLEILLGGKSSAREFLQASWPNGTYHKKAQVNRLSDFCELAALCDVDDVLKHGAASTAKVQLGGDELEVSPTTIGGESVFSDAQRSDLKRLHHIGTQLYFANLRGYPRLQESMRGLANRLGIPRDRVRCNLFTVQAGSEFTPGLHWDNSEGFVVQLSGRKRWFSSPNTSIRFPPMNHFHGRSPTQEHALLFDEAPKPGQLQETVMEPGDILFLPRGHWHKTEATEASVHLDIMLLPPTWGDLMSQSVDRICLEEALLREPIGSSSTSFETGFEQARKLLVEELTGLGPVEIALAGLGGPTADGLAFEIVDGVQAELIGPLGSIVGVRFHRDNKTLLQLGVAGPGIAAMLEWMIQSQGAFDLRSLRDEVPAVVYGEACKFLRLLWYGEVISASITESAMADAQEPDGDES